MATVKDTDTEAFETKLLEKEKMLDTSIFSFSNDALYPMTDNTVHVAYFFWSANAFNLDRSRILQYGKEFIQSFCNI